MKLGSFVLYASLILSTAIPATFAQTTRAPEVPAESGTRKVRIKTAPVYPELAKQMNVSGKVKLEVTVASDGHVTSTRTIGGSPLLVPPSLEAVKKWRYEPGPKETTEIIEFSFSRD